MNDKSRKKAEAMNRAEEDVKKPREESCFFPPKSVTMVRLGEDVQKTAISDLQIFVESV